MLPIRLFSPLFYALCCTLLLLIWLLLGDHYQSQTTAPTSATQMPEKIFTVQTRWSNAQAYAATLTVQGQLQPWYQLELQAQGSGKISRFLKDQGDQVQQGEVLLELTDEGRSSRLAQAKALLALRQTELQSAEALLARQLISTTELSRLNSELKNAEYALKEAELAIAYSRPTAPFSGLLARRLAVPGSLVAPGTPLYQLVDIAKLKATGQVPQQQLSRLALGQQVSIDLLDGRMLAGTLSFISPAADSASRSYYIEATIANPDLLPLAGASATLTIQLNPVTAHSISPALLKLDKQGRLGVYTVQEQHVAFNNVSLLHADNNEAWISGLPERVQLLILGSGFVEVGQRVKVSTGATE